MMMHHHTKFGYKSLGILEAIIQINNRQKDTWKHRHMVSNFLTLLLQGE